MACFVIIKFKKRDTSLQKETAAHMHCHVLHLAWRMGWEGFGFPEPVPAMTVYVTNIRAGCVLQHGPAVICRPQQGGYLWGEWQVNQESGVY